jgi:AbiV family abortive infection protein
LSLDEKTLFTQYKGPLTSGEIAFCSKATKFNAESLLMASELLFNNGHYSGSVALSIVSIEESSKPSILLFDIGMSETEEELIKAWRCFRSHSEKNPFWQYSEFARFWSHKDPNLAPLLVTSGITPKSLDSVKQNALYFDVHKEKTWMVPFAIFTKEVAELFLGHAKSFVKFPLLTREEIEAWIKHMRPMLIAIKQAKEITPEIYEMFIAFAKEAYGDNTEKYKDIVSMFDKFLGKPSVQN